MAFLIVCSIVVSFIVLYSSCVVAGRSDEILKKKGGQKNEDFNLIHDCIKTEK